MCPANVPCPGRGAGSAGQAIAIGGPHSLRCTAGREAADLGAARCPAAAGRSCRRGRWGGWVGEPVCKPIQGAVCQASDRTNRMQHLRGEGAQFPEEAVVGEVFDGGPARRRLVQLLDPVPDGNAVIRPPSGERTDPGSAHERYRQPHGHGCRTRERYPQPRSAAAGVPSTRAARCRFTGSRSQVGSSPTRPGRSRLKPTPNSRPSRPGTPARGDGAQGPAPPVPELSQAKSEPAPSVILRALCRSLRGAESPCKRHPEGCTWLLILGDSPVQGSLSPEHPSRTHPEDLPVLMWLRAQDTGLTTSTAITIRDADSRSLLYPTTDSRYLQDYHHPYSVPIESLSNRSRGPP